MRFLRPTAILAALFSGAMAVSSVLGAMGLFTPHMEGVTQFNELARQTDSEINRVFFQLQIIEAQMLYQGQLLQSGIACTLFLLSLILLGVVLKRD